MLRGQYLAVVFVPLVLLGPGSAQRQTQHRQRAKTEAAAGQKQLYKGILEPVNYPKDINLTDIFFVNAETGWVAGEHATILRTSDGGTTWTAQLGGDPNNSEKKITLIRFLDERQGWAVQEDNPLRLLHTNDGQNWDLVNASFPPGVPVLDFAFTSEQHGIMLGGNGDAFYVTNDGGQHWQSAGSCQLNVTVEGLAQTPNCHFIKLQMFSARSGVALAWWGSSKDDVLVFFHTDDAGEHWSYAIPDVTDSRYASAFFTDQNHGVLVFNNDGRTYTTADGGKKWHALLATSIGPNIAFADPEVGWALGGSKSNWRAGKITYTTDGGQHWQASAEIRFPTDDPEHLKLSFPSRDHAYIIGPHGMIYRYRIVPAEYKAANALPAPLMPAVHNARQDGARPTH